MVVPARFRVTKPTKKLVLEMIDLCNSIERASGGSLEQYELIAKWNQRTNRRYERHEFENYWRSIDQKVFVKEALCPSAKYVADLTYPEARAILEAIRNATLPEQLISYYLDFLDRQFPNCRVSDLIYWPDCWFDDPSMFRGVDGAFQSESNFTSAQILNYLMKKSLRQLPEAAVDVLLPFPVPTKW